VALEPEASAGLAPQAVATSLTSAIRRANEGLNDAEQIRRFAIVGETWLPGGDELTPTMKLKRKPIAAKHAALIESLYEGEGSHAVHRT
jgi:long-chain acyl-CoA synthetase